MPGAKGVLDAIRQAGPVKMRLRSREELQDTLARPPRKAMQGSRNRWRKPSASLLTFL